MDRQTMDQQIYAILCDVADKGEPCPTARAIGNVIGLKEKATRLSIKRLEAAGRITIDGQVGCRRRVIHIAGTDQSTSPEIITASTRMQDREVAPIAEIFEAAIARNGGRFEDHPDAKARGCAVYIPNSLTQFSECGISTVYGL